MPPTPSQIVPPELEGPLDRAVRALFGASWGKARSWIGAGKVRVGGTVVLEPTARVRAGMSIDLNERARRPRAGELSGDEVVFADAQVIVVAKPAGVSTVPYDDGEIDTLDLRVRGWMGGQGLSPRGSRPTLGLSLIHIFRCHRVSASSRVHRCACPMCRLPVTLGGGMGTT